MCVGGKWSPCAALAQHKFDTTLETPICTLYFLTSKSLEKTTNSPPQLNVSLNSVVFTNFKSVTTNLYKYSLTFKLLYRAFKLSSNSELFH